MLGTTESFSHSRASDKIEFYNIPKGSINKHNFLRNGLAHLEDIGRSNKTVRPVVSKGKGNGKIWRIDVGVKYDIDFETEDSTSESLPV